MLMLKFIIKLSFGPNKEIKMCEPILNLIDNGSYVTVRLLESQLEPTFSKYGNKNILENFFARRFISKKKYRAKVNKFISSKFLKLEERNAISRMVLTNSINELLKMILKYKKLLTQFPGDIYLNTMLFYIINELFNSSEFGKKMSTFDLKKCLNKYKAHKKAYSKINLSGAKIFVPSIETLMTLYSIDFLDSEVNLRSRINLLTKEISEYTYPKNPKKEFTSFLHNKVLGNPIIIKDTDSFGTSKVLIVCSPMNFLEQRALFLQKCSDKNIIYTPTAISQFFFDTFKKNLSVSSAIRTESTCFELSEGHLPYSENWQLSEIIKIHIRFYLENR